MGRCRDIEPDDIVCFSAKALSFDSLKLRQRRGARPCSCQILTTDEAAIPTVFAIARTVQCLLLGRFQRQRNHLIASVQ